MWKSAWRRFCERRRVEVGGHQECSTNHSQTEVCVLAVNSLKAVAQVWYRMFTVDSLPGTAYIMERLR